MKKFLKNLEEELKKRKINEEEIKEILADHEEMIESAINEGLSDEELEAKFGDPKNVADELSEFSSRKKEKDAKADKDIIFDSVKDNFNVEIKLINEDVEVISHDEKSIIIKAFRIQDLDKYIIEFKNNRLFMQAPKYKGINIFRSGSRNGKFEIYLPENMQIDTFGLKNINGDFELENLKIKEFDAGNNNGDLELNNLELGDFKASGINGDISIDNVTCVEFNISTINGDAEINKLVCENDIFANTVSGDLEISNSSCRDATLKTVSGDLDGEEFYPKSVSLSSVSGDICIRNKDASRPIEIRRKKSISGDVEIIIGK